MRILSQNSFKLKIKYDSIKNSSILTSRLKMSAIIRAKNIGYIYYNELDEDTKYNIAKDVFRNLSIIYRDTKGKYIFDFEKLGIDDRVDKVVVDSISQDDMISYFNKYYIKNENDVNNLFTTVYKHEYVVPVASASLFMDTTTGNILELETNINDFIVNTYRRFISTPQGSVPFIPWFGTRIKEYLHDLSVYQVEEMLQAEMDGLTGMLKSYLAENNIAEYNINVKVETIENIEYGIVKYKINVYINDVNYTITIH